MHFVERKAEEKCIVAVEKEPVIENSVTLVAVGTADERNRLGPICLRCPGLQQESGLLSPQLDLGTTAPMLQQLLVVTVLLSTVENEIGQTKHH